LFIFIPAFPLGRVKGAATLGGPEIPQSTAMSDSSAGSIPRRDQSRSHV